MTERYWPDFRTTDLLEALLVYQKRNRRFGGLPDQSPEPLTANVPATNGKLLAVNK